MKRKMIQTARTTIIVLILSLSFFFANGRAQNGAPNKYAQIQNILLKRDLSCKEFAKFGKIDLNRLFQHKKMKAGLLHDAIMQKRHEFIKCIIKKGADVNLRDSLHFTALHAAAVLKDVKSAALLLNAGADINPGVGKENLTPATIALANKDNAFLRLLLAACQKRFPNDLSCPKYGSLVNDP